MNPGLQILDVGCGGGILSEPLGKLLIYFVTFLVLMFSALCIKWQCNGFYRTFFGP